MSDYDGDIDTKIFYIEDLFRHATDMLRMLQSFGLSYADVKVKNNLGELMAWLDTKNVK